ncbi:hypothetical protein OG604_00765 [Streptomyces sp. NBC_01231]|nr:hypothetical protein OG604_00765 [Streptomyces sp. NBC_01231]
MPQPSSSTRPTDAPDRLQPPRGERVLRRQFTTDVSPRRIFCSRECRLKARTQRPGAGRTHLSGLQRRLRRPQEPSGRSTARPPGAAVNWTLAALTPALFLTGVFVVLRARRTRPGVYAKLATTDID